MEEMSLTALLTGTRDDTLAEAEAAIIALLAGYDPRRDGAAIDATRMAALTVRCLRTGEAATEIETSFVVVPREPSDTMIEAARKRRMELIHAPISRIYADLIRAAVAAGDGHEA